MKSIFLSLSLMQRNLSSYITISERNKNHMVGRDFNKDGMTETQRNRDRERDREQGTLFPPVPWSEFTFLYLNSCAFKNGKGTWFKSMGHLILLCLQFCLKHFMCIRTRAASDVEIPFLPSGQGAGNRKYTREISGWGPYLWAYIVYGDIDMRM